MVLSTVLLQAGIMLGLILFSVVPVVLLVSIILAWLFERRSNRVTDADAKKRYKWLSVFFQLVFIVALVLVVLLFVVNPTID